MDDDDYSNTQTLDNNAPVMMLNLVCSWIRVLDKNNHSFTFIFSSSELIKLMEDDKRPNTCKTVYFDGI
jgi:hypothetical protein